MNRRHFIQSSLTMPVIIASSMPFASFATSRSPYVGRTLLLIELNGGNDGLNTVIPYADPLYKKFRPKLAIPRDSVLQINEKLGFHSALKPLMGHWQQKDMAIALGVGYPNPVLSHFRSIDIWDQASLSNEYLKDGWISQAFSENPPSKSIPADGIILGRNSYGPLVGKKMRTVSLKDPKQLRDGLRIQKINEITADDNALSHILGTGEQLRSTAEAIINKNITGISTGIEFPETNFGDQMKLAAKLIISSVGVPVIKASLSGFDTHSNQIEEHPILLSELANGIAAFSASMWHHQLWNQILVMTYSEFGRRPSENFSDGTDHGTSAPHFILGGLVKGGLYGEQPPLDSLEGKNLTYRMHFTQLYASVAKEWWGLKADFLKHAPLNCIL